MGGGKEVKKQLADSREKQEAACLFLQPKLEGFSVLVTILVGNPGKVRALWVLLHHI